MFAGRQYQSKPKGEANMRYIVHFAVESLKSTSRTTIKLTVSPVDQPTPAQAIYAAEAFLADAGVRLPLDYTARASKLLI
jgi:hypothetical protein